METSQLLGSQKNKLLGSPKLTSRKYFSEVRTKLIAGDRPLRPSFAMFLIRVAESTAVPGLHNLVALTGDKIAVRSAPTTDLSMFNTSLCSDFGIFH